MSSIKCANCGLVNFAADESCKRCGAVLAEMHGANQSAGDSPRERTRGIKRWLITPALICLLLFVFYVSLLVTSDPISFEQKQAVHRAIKVLEEKNFDREAFMMRHFVNYRATDNWWNNAVGHADAYASTNFPFEVVTLYPDFFRVATDDTERAVILLHESHHLRGRGEAEAFANVWRDKKRLGWTQDVYGQTQVWKNVREFTANYAPQLFKCGADSQTNCAD